MDGWQKIIMVLIMALFLISVLFIIFELSIPAYVQRNPINGPLPNGMLKDAMKWHPVLAPKYDEELGTYVFYRDGKRCQLFTVAFFEAMNYPREW